MPFGRVFAKPKPRRQAAGAPPQGEVPPAPQNRYTLNGPLSWQAGAPSNTARDPVFGTFRGRVPSFAADRMDIDGIRPASRGSMMDWRPATREGDRMDWRPASRDSAKMDWRPTTPNVAAVGAAAPRPGTRNGPRPLSTVFEQPARDPFDDLASSLTSFPTEVNGGTERNVHGKYKRFVPGFFRR